MLPSLRVVGFLHLASLLAACDIALLRGLSPEQAQTLTTELARGGVIVRAVPDTASRVRLELNESAVPDAVALLSRSEAGGRCEAATPAADSGKWLETPGEERARQTYRLERELEQSLALLPGVAKARVHVTLPAGMRSLPEAQSRPAASVLLVRSSDAQLGQAPQELVAGAVPGLAVNQVRVVTTRREPQAAGRPSLARLGPIVVARESLGTLKAWLAAALILQMALAVALLRPLVARKLGARR